MQKKRDFLRSQRPRNLGAGLQKFRVSLKDERMEGSYIADWVTHQLSLLMTSASHPRDAGQGATHDVAGHGGLVSDAAAAAMIHSGQFSYTLIGAR